MTDSKHGNVCKRKGCGGAVVSGKLCEKHRAIQRGNKKARYKDLRSRGLPLCSHNGCLSPRIFGLKVCAEHSSQVATTLSQAVQDHGIGQRVISGGGCCRVGVCKEPPEPGKRMCARHAAENRRKISDRRARAKEAGLCYRCNKPARPGGILCEEHRSRQTEREHTKVVLERPHKVLTCTICGKVSCYRYCKEHRLEVLALERTARTRETSEALKCTVCGIWGHHSKNCALVEQRRVEAERVQAIEAQQVAEEMAARVRLRSLSLQPGSHKCRVCDELTMTEFCWKHFWMTDPLRVRRAERKGVPGGELHGLVESALAVATVPECTYILVNEGPRIEDEPGFEWVPREMPLVDPGWGLWLDQLNREVPG